MNKLLILILSIVSTIGFAQNAKEDMDVKDPKAKEILDKLSKKNKTNTTMKVAFSFNLANPDQKINETQKGTLLLKGNKFKIDVDKISITSDGKTKWIFTKASKEVQVDNATPNEEDAIDPTKIFTMHEKGFKFKYIGTKVMDSKTCHEIKLFPEEANKKEYHSVILYIDKATEQLYKAQINSKNGNKSTYTLSKIEANVPLTDASFVFDTKQATEVIDLRE